MFITLNFVRPQISDEDFRIVERFGLHVLVAILPQTVHDLLAVQLAFGFMDKVFGGVADQRQFMVDIGLVQSLCKAFVRFYQRWGMINEQGAAVQAMHQFATTIALQSILGAGTIHVGRSSFRVEHFEKSYICS